MQRNIRKYRSGFTLVEILIVVIILGILAAIVIPQFTNASTSAKQSNMVSQLQTLRSQIALYKLQHNDQFPDLTVAGNWTLLTQCTDQTGASNGTTVTDATHPYGPYLPSPPVNPLTTPADPTNPTVVAYTAPGAAVGTTVSWVQETAVGGTGLIHGVNALGNESDDGQ